MKILVIYDSVFGNTQKIAEAIAGGLGNGGEVELLHVGAAALEAMAGRDILVVGSPTRGFQPTPELAKLLKSLPSGTLKGTKVAAFDTRFKADELDSAGVRFIVKTGGYAAKRIAALLQKAGGRLAAPGEGFYVEDTEGPLKAGELERASVWAQALLAI
jgi:flavodoxin